MLACLLVEIVWIDRLSIFQNYMRLLNPRKLLLEDGDRIVHAHRNNCASSLLSNLKGAIVEGKDAKFLAWCPPERYR